MKCGRYVSKKTDKGGKKENVNKNRPPYKFQVSVLFFRFGQNPRMESLPIPIVRAPCFYFCKNLKKKLKLEISTVILRIKQALWAPLTYLMKYDKIHISLTKPIFFA